MLYLMYGTKSFNIKKQIDTIKKDFNKLNINTYDLSTTTLKEIIEDANTISIFDEKKLIICENTLIFTRGYNNEINLLENYFQNPNPNTTIIFIANKETIDGVKKITKLIKKIGTVLEFNKDQNPYNLVQNEFKNYKISPNTINTLINRVGTNPLILENEIKKIKIFKDNDFTINEDDIINLTTKTIDLDIFKLIEFIVTKDKNKALELYHEMLKTNEEPIKIIILLASQFRIMYQTKELLKRGMSKNDIASTLKIHPYRVEIAMQQGRKYDSKTLLKYLNNLADLDINIKTGKTNKDLALEMFILKE